MKSSPESSAVSCPESQGYRAFFEQARIGLALLREDGSWADLNEQLCTILGYERAELIGLGCAGLFLRSDEESALRLSDIVSAGSGGLDLPLRHKQGYVVHSHATAVALEGGLYALTLLDVTDEFESRLELIRAYNELERSNSELENFAFIASHDLQEPLRSIGGYVQLIDRRYRGQLDSDADEFIEFIVSSVRRMKELIDDLLKFSRVGRREEQKSEVALDEIFTQLRKDYAAQISQSDINVEIGPMPTLSANPVQMRQVFQNLFSNAIKFRTADNPLVRVSAVREGVFWHIEIEDNGIGIEHLYFDRIFVLFQRLHSRGEYVGTGIGLALVKKIIENHDGRVWVESTPGQGATFHVLLPVCGQVGQDD